MGEEGYINFDGVRGRFLSLLIFMVNCLVWIVQESLMGASCSSVCFRKHPRAKVWNWRVCALFQKPKEMLPMIWSFGQLFGFRYQTQSHSEKRRLVPETTKSKTT
jgi:hypothetical protein